MANSSRIPAAIDALVTAWSTALPAALVLDGPGKTADPNRDVLFVGVQDPSGDDMLAADAAVSWAGIGKMSRDERFTIWCTAQSVDGAARMQTARNAAFALVAAAETTVTTNSNLGGVVIQGITDQFVFRQHQATSGAIAEVTFGVLCHARLSTS